jgi:hypothetical protein
MQESQMRIVLGYALLIVGFFVLVAMPVKSKTEQVTNRIMANFEQAVK